MSSCSNPAECSTQADGESLKRAHIFRHPVGIFPAAARWYLAAIAMLCLLSVAMHLSIQMHAQQRAEKMIHAWGEAAGVAIGDVRYHLLRNGLILQNIHIERGSDSVSIDHLLVRANPELLTGSEPRIGRVELSGLNATIHQPADSSLWQRDRKLNQIWKATTTLNVHDGELMLYLKQNNAPPMSLKKLTMQQRTLSSVRTITGSATTDEGALHWQWKLADSPQGYDGWLSNGLFSWQGVSAERMTSAMGLKKTAGQLDGRLEWRTRQVAPEKPAPLNMKGQIHFHAGSDSAPDQGHRLQFSALQSDGDWKLEIDATAWPLDPWSETLPVIDGRQLVSAQLDGEMLWRGRAESWNISSKEGVLQDVVYAAADSNTPAWYWSRVNYADASLNTAKHRLRVSRLDVVDSRMALRPQSYQPDHGEQQAIWDISADKINVSNMMLALELPHGRVSLATMKGSCSWPRKSDLNFILRTDVPAEAEEAGTPVTRWRLQGVAKRGARHPLASATISVRGSNIPAAQLRPLLPLLNERDRPITLAGDIDLKGDISVGNGLWQMQGKASALELHLSHGGDTWFAEEASIRFGPVGMGLEKQRFSKLDVNGWQYIATLQPLPPFTPDTDKEAMQNAATPAWWLSSLRNNGIEIDDIQLKSGSFSMGHAQAVWAEDMDIRIDRLRDSTRSNIMAGGKSGGGTLVIKGEWGALSEPQRFVGVASISEATPFFLHDWMRASGMPRLIRGRLSARLESSHGNTAESYRRMVTVTLKQGLAEAGKFPDDPMRARTGYSTHELLKRLDAGNGNISLHYEASGFWSEAPLALKNLGLGLQESLHQSALAREAEQKTAASRKSPAASSIETRIRLHDRKLLSQNERSRIFKVVKKLRRNPGLVVELRPRWAGDALTADMQRRISRTQQLIERYMTHRNIDAGRIFPLWPMSEDQVDEIGSVQIVTRKAG